MTLLFSFNLLADDVDPVIQKFSYNIKIKPNVYYANGNIHNSLADSILNELKYYYENDSCKDNLIQVFEEAVQINNLVKKCSKISYDQKTSDFQYYINNHRLYSGFKMSINIICEKRPINHLLLISRYNRCESLILNDDIEGYISNDCEQIVIKYLEKGITETELPISIDEFTCGQTPEPTSLGYSVFNQIYGIN